MITTFTHPRSADYSTDLRVTADGVSIQILRTDAADFANFIYDPTDGPVEIVVERQLGPIAAAKVRPRRHAIRSAIDGPALRFSLSQPLKLAIEIDGLRPLFLWANPPETDRPSPDDPNVLYYAAGQTYEVPELELQSGQTLYLEGGAVLKGSIRAKEAENIAIRGHGILDGSYYLRSRGESSRSILLDRCRNVDIRDIAMIRPSTWMVTLGCCRDVRVRNLKQIGEVVSSDGIDVVGSQDVTIEDCFLRNNDDCIVVKAFRFGRTDPNAAGPDFRQNPSNILAQNCTLLNDRAGNAMEIGHELSVDRVSDITFRDIDVLSVHGHGAVFSIHNYDRSTVENVLWEDIRIEHCYDRVIDIRIARSRFSSDEERGQIRNIVFRNIDWQRTPSNEGYTTSVIGGWDPDHQVQNVTLQNFRIDGQPISHLDALEIYTRHAENIQLKA